MQPCDRDGTFRGVIVEYGLKDFQSGSTAVKYRAELSEMYNFETEQWMPWEEYQMEVYGDQFVVKKDGKLNTNGVNALMNHAGWNGSFDAIHNNRWRPTPCQFKVTAEEYQGKTYYKVAFINGFDDVPGGSMPSLDEKRVKQLDETFTKQLRALGGNQARNEVAPPAGSRPAPPSKSAPPAKREEAPAPATGDDIPF
jgi:hypothetical protein